MTTTVQGSSTGVMGPVFDEMVAADADPLVVSALLKMASTLVIAMSEITDRSSAEILACLRTGDFTPLFEDDD